MKPENGRPNLMEMDFNLNSDPIYWDEDLKRIQGKISPRSVLLITILGIAVAEMIAMIAVYFVRDLPYYQQVLIDATVMTVIIFPLLYYLSFRPILQHVQQRYQVEKILKSRLRIVQHASTHELDETLQYSLDELENLTGSKAGYFHFVSLDQKTIKLQTWSTNTVENICQVNGVETHYSLDDAGVWADCIRQRRVVIHNDYASLPNRKGFPIGHANIVREMAVPIIRNEKIVAVLGLGNKPDHYTDNDTAIVTTLADFLWDIIKYKLAADAQRESEEKFRTLADWTYDWELWLDPEGHIVYSSPSCHRITGYTSNEFSDNPDLLINIAHPEDRNLYEEHHQLIHDETADVSKIEYRVISQNGVEHWIEHVCRPVFGMDNRYLGRRISNRDVTQRRQAEKELEERNKKEKLLTETIHNMQLDIARDLHDTIGQNIGFLRMKLEYLSGRTSVKKSEMKSELQTMIKAANESYDLIRGTLAVLQTNNSADLFRIFSRYAEQIQERSSVKVEFSMVGEPKSLSSRRIRQLFYIFREALTNVEKHAQASLVSITMHWEQDRLSLSVVDNGKGFNTLETFSGSHYGLRFMRERADLLNGSVRVHSAVGSGTQLVIEVPYE